jgi:hypothetical protein
MQCLRNAGTKLHGVKYQKAILVTSKGFVLDHHRTNPPPTAHLPPPEVLTQRSPNCSQSVSNLLTLFLVHVISSTLKMEAKCSSEAPVYNELTRHSS